MKLLPNRKLPIIFIVFVIIASFTLFLYFRKYGPNEIPDGCSKFLGGGGWTCQPGEGDSSLEAEEFCKGQGGTFEYRGVDKCFLPLSDEGKECTDSSQCRGICVLDSKKNQSGVGECSKYILINDNNPCGDMYQGTDLYFIRNGSVKHRIPGWC